MFSNLNSFMKKFALFGVLLVAALILSGCVTPQNIPAEDNSLDNVQSDLPDSSQDSIDNGQDLVDNGQDSVVVTEDCGSVTNTHLLITEELTAVEKLVLDCFNEKISTCSVGRVELPGQGDRSITINAEEESYCIMTFVNPSETKTCRIPKSFISDAATFAEENSQPEILLIALGFGVNAGSLQNIETGEPIVLECT